MKVIFSNRAFAAILAETTEKIQTETGGLFLGTIENDIWYIVESIDPGPNSIFKEAYFEYDQVYTQHLINKVANLYNVSLSLIGLWHRHPGSFNRFSATDDGTNKKYAIMRSEGAISALVNIDPSFRLTVYHVGQPCKYSRVEYEVGDHFIPDKFFQYKSSDKFKELMEKRLTKLQNAQLSKKPWLKIRLSQFMEYIYPCLEKEIVQVDNSIDVDEETAISRILDETVDDIAFLSDKCGIAMSLIKEGAYICIKELEEGSEPMKIYFGYMPESDIIYLFLNRDCFIYKRNLLKKAYKKAKQSPLLSDALKKLIRKTVNGE